MQITALSRVQGVVKDFWTEPNTSMLGSRSYRILGNETADAPARLGSLSSDDLLVGPVPLFAISTTPSMDGSGRKSRGVGDPFPVGLFLDVYGLP